MSTSPRTILYSSLTCPFAQRVRIALIEAGAPFELELIDLKNKPEWYAPNINPASKVPALSYGARRDSPVSKPDEGVFILPESLLQLQFVADLYPQLAADDAVGRAKEQLLIHHFGNTFLPAWQKFAYNVSDSSLDTLIASLRTLQPLIPASPSSFKVAEIAAAPFVVRTLLALENNVGVWKEGEEKKVLEILEGGELERVWKWFEFLSRRESVKNTWDPKLVLEGQAQRVADIRAA